MKRILITGGAGYIGSQLYNSINSCIITLTTHQTCDLTKADEVANLFENEHFDVVIHTASVGGSRLKSDDINVITDNLRMYENISKNHAHYDRLILLGSGAEIYYSKTPYGISKKVISAFASENPNQYVIRLFAVFNEFEKDTRFIKANIKRYLNHQPIEVYEQRVMDFFYMDDLVTLINYYICNKNVPKQIDACYSYHDNLCDIANFIGNLDTWKVPIHMNFDGHSKQRRYTGKYTKLPIDWIGLEEGIERTYNALKNDHTSN